MPRGRECLRNSIILICKSSKQIGKVSSHKQGVLTTHPYKRNPNYRHCRIQSVKPIRLTPATGSEKEQSWRIRLDLILTIEID